MQVPQIAAERSFLEQSILGQAKYANLEIYPQGFMGVMQLGKAMRNFEFVENFGLCNWARLCAILNLSRILGYAIGQGYA